MLWRFQNDIINKIKFYPEHIIPKTMPVKGSLTSDSLKQKWFKIQKKKVCYNGYQQILIQLQYRYIRIMGNSVSESKASIESMLQELKEVRRDSNGIILEDKQGQNSYFLKQLTFADAEEFEREKQRLKGQQNQQYNENILKLIKFSCHQFNTFCSNSYKIYAIYEYPTITLLDEINARNAQSKYFDESQLWSILQSSANAFHYLTPGLCLHPKSVFVMSDGILKVICNDLIQQDHRCIMKESIYYAPEKICNFHQNQNQINLEKERIFSLGMTLLHAALLKQVNRCYNYNKYQFLNNQLENYIEQLYKLEYSSEFIEIMAMILEPNSTQRASLIQLQEMLIKYSQTETQNQDSDHFQENRSEAHKQQRSQRENINLSNQKGQLHFQNEEYLQNLQKSYNFISETHQTSKDKQNLFTDPKLLEMIRKDLHEIGQLKKNSYHYLNNYGNIDYHHPSFCVNTANTQCISQPKSYEAVSPDKSDSHRNFVASLSYNINKSKPGTQSSQNVALKQNSLKREVLKEVNTEQVEKKVFKKPKNLGSQQQYVFIAEEFGDGRKFEGNIINGMKEGYGKLTYSDGAYYEGDFHQNKMEGNGILYYQIDRPAYDGEWVNDQFHGFGILYNENPIPLNCQFNYNNFNMVDGYWIRYEGFFYGDNKCGQGKLFLSNGQSFDGLFQNDTITGRGKFMSKNQDESFEQIYGVWEDNILVQLIQNS